RGVSARGTATRGRRPRRLRGHQHGAFRRTRRGKAGLDLRRGGLAGLGERGHDPCEPSLVVRHPQVVGGRQDLNAVAERVQVPQPGAAGAKHAPERIHAPFPRMVEHRLARLAGDRTHVLHAAHVVDAVHPRASAVSSVTFAVPIIESRVTRAANCSSLRCSLPAGRSGSTRYRSSAVLSHTWTSTSSARSRPNSFNTPRGSITPRGRYGADLYQTGGSPRIGHG